MRRSLTSLIVVGSMMAFIACGTSKEDQQRTDQARMDSLATALALRQAASDSTNTQSGTENESTLDIGSLNFNDSGRYVVQVGAWRSESKATEITEVWKKRGYANATVHTFGNESTGDIWFRVRLGRMTSRSEADALVTHIQARHGLVAWVDTISTK